MRWGLPPPPPQPERGVAAHHRGILPPLAKHPGAAPAFTHVQAPSCMRHIVQVISNASGYLVRI